LSFKERLLNRDTFFVDLHGLFDADRIYLSRRDHQKCLILALLLAKSDMLGGQFGLWEFLYDQRLDLKLWKQGHLIKSHRLSLLSLHQLLK
jgi:hypothetical protein